MTRLPKTTRFWLLAYPPSIRREFGREMSTAMVASWQEQRSVGGRARLVLDLARDAAASWRRKPGGRRPPAERRDRSRLVGLGADLRAACRLFVREPLFALGAVVTLAIGIGATVAVVSLADATILRPLAIVRPDRVVAVDFSWSYPTFRALEAEAETSPLSGVGAWSDQRFGLDRNGISTEIHGHVVSGGYFAMTGVRPIAGRLLVPDDDRAGAPPAVVVTERAWHRLLGSDPSIVGSTIAINRTPVTVVGVTPASFRGLSLSSAPDVFLPIHSLSIVGTGTLSKPESLERLGLVWLNVDGRLRDDARVEQATSAVGALYNRVNKGGPGDRPDPVTLEPIARRALASANVRDPVRFVYVLLSAALVTLLLACATVANLLLVRSTRRRRELGVRAALGASRGRLARLVGIESLTIGVAGSLAATVVAEGTLRLLGSFSLPGRIAIADLDLRVSPALFGTAVALGIVTSLVFGLAPAWSGSRASAQTALRDGARGASRQPVRGALVTTQVTLCVLLLLGSVAFGRAMRLALSTDFGFDTAHTTLVTVTPSRARYTRARMAEVERRIEEGLRAEPWVDHQAWMSIAPLSGMMAWDIGIPGVTAPGQRLSTEDNVVSTGYFDAMGIPLLRGRAFSPDDRAGAPLVAIVNEAMARKYWPAGALGALIATNPGAGDPAFATVVGVVGNMRRALAGVPSPMFYVPLAQQASELDSTQTLVVRSRLSPDATVAALTATLPRLEPGVPIGAPEPMVDHLGTLLMPQRLGLTLFLLFAGLAVVLTAFGIYAVVASAVAQRVREIGIRVALGAARGRVIRLVVRQGLTPVLSGAVLGAAAFGLAGSTLKSFVFGLPTLTAGSVALAAVAIAALALGAMVIPARRALAIEPTAALKTE